VKISRCFLCHECQDPIPETRALNALYCSRACRDAAKTRRIRPKKQARNRLFKKRHPSIANGWERMRRARRLQATPEWLSESDKLGLRHIYKSCKIKTAWTGVRHSVDHIVPIQGDAVCGLHVPWNVRVVTSKDNLAKGNRF